MSISQALRRGFGRLSQRDLAATLVKGAGIAFLITGIGQGLSAVLQVVLARLATKEVYGTYTWVNAWVSAFTIFIGLGLPQTSLRFIAEYSGLNDWARCKGVANRSQAIVLLTGIAFAAVGSALLLVINVHHRLSYLVPFLIGLWMVPVASQAALLTQMSRAMRRVAWAFAPGRIAQPVILAALALLIFAVGRPIHSVEIMAAAWVALFLTAGVQFLVFRRDMKARASADVPIYETRRWLTVSMPLMLMGGFQMVFSQVDILTVGALLGPVSVAIFGAANRTVNFVDFILAATNVALGPEAADLHARGETAQLQKAVTTMVRMAFWPALAATIVLLVLGRYILSVFGHGYTAGYEALCVLAVGCLISAGAGPVMLLLNMTGFERVSARVLGICAVVDIVLNIAFVHEFGYLGAAWASALTMALWNVWLAVMVKRHLGIQSFIFFAR